jgi:hypothetical protein
MVASRCLGFRKDAHVVLDTAQDGKVVFVEVYDVHVSIAAC